MIRECSRMCQSGHARSRPLKWKLVQTRKINSLFQMIASMLLMWLSISVYVFILKKQWWLLIQVLRRINPFWLHKKGVKLCIRVTPWFRASPENRPQKSNYFKVNTTNWKCCNFPHMVIQQYIQVQTDILHVRFLLGTFLHVLLSLLSIVSCFLGVFSNITDFSQI